MKTCRTCHKEKPLSDYHKKASNKDGYNTMCKSCKNAQTRKAHAINPEIQHNNRKRQHDLYPWKSTFRVNWYVRGSDTRIETEKEAMRDFYKNCPVGYEVDHIIPLCKGGTHSMDNVQYLTMIDNRKKGAIYE